MQQGIMVHTEQQSAQPPPRVKQQKGERKAKATPRQQGYYQECNGTAGPGTRAGKSVQTGKQTAMAKGGSTQTGREGGRGHGRQEE